MRIRSFSHAFLAVTAMGVMACSGSSGGDDSTSSSSSTSGGGSTSAAASSTMGGSSTMASSQGGSSGGSSGPTSTTGSSTATSNVATSGATSQMQTSGATSGTATSGATSEMATSGATSAATSGTPTSGATSTASGATSSTSATSGGASSASSTMVGSSSSGATSASSGMSLEGTECTMTSQCGTGTGLECLGGFCLQRCTTPDQPSTCGAGRFCLALNNPAGTNACFTLPGRDEGCLAGGLCAGTLDCRYAEYDDMGAPVTTATFANACQQGCSPAQPTLVCSGNERCFTHPGLTQYLDPQLNGAGQPVSCTTPGQPTGCDAANGYTCVGRMAGNVCARSHGFCGTGLPPFDLDFPQGQEPATNTFCNSGPTLFSNQTGEVLYAGSVGCTPVTQDPTATFCSRQLALLVNEGADLSNVPGLGLCIAVCDYSDAGGVRETTPCTQGYTCNLDIISNGPAQPAVTCTNGGQAACDAVDPNLYCGPPQNGVRSCVYRYGICQAN